MKKDTKITNNENDNHILLGVISDSKGVNGDFILNQCLKNIKTIKNLKQGIKVKVGFTFSFSKEFTLINFRYNHNSIIVKFKEIHHPESVVDYKEMGVFIPEKLVAYQDDDSYYVNELIGCAVFDKKSKKSIGELIDVLILPANDVWLIKTPDGELPLPVIKDVIKKVDIKNKKIEISLIDGLMDLIG